MPLLVQRAPLAPALSRAHAIGLATRLRPRPGADGRLARVLLRRSVPWRSVGGTACLPSGALEAGPGPPLTASRRRQGARRSALKIQ